MKYPLRIVAITSSSLHQEAHIETLVRVFASRGVGLTPTRFGHHQPLKQQFSMERIQDLAAEIEHNTILWRAPKSFVNLAGYVQGVKYGAMWADFMADALAPAELPQFVCDVMTALQPDLGVVHLLNEHDHAADVAKGTRVDAAGDPAFGVYPKDLAHGLPDFYWGMVFGRPYCEMFGIDRLLATPAHTIKRLGEALVYVQLTADVNDCEHNHAALMQARQLAKRHLGHEAFMPDERDGMLAKARQLPLVGKFMNRHAVAPALVP